MRDPHSFFFPHSLSKSHLMMFLFQVVHLLLINQFNYLHILTLSFTKFLKDVTVWIKRRSYRKWARFATALFTISRLGIFSLQKSTFLANWILRYMKNYSNLRRSVDEKCLSRSNVRPEIIFVLAFEKNTWVGTLFWRFSQKSAEVISRLCFRQGSETYVPVVW